MTLQLKAAKRVLLAAGYDADEISELIRGIKADAWDKGAHKALRHYTDIPMAVSRRFDLDDMNPYRGAKP